MKENDQPAWDAREHFTRELVYRGHIYLDCNEEDIKAKYAALMDFYLWASCKVGKNILNDLMIIEKLIYAKTDKNNVLYTDSDKRRRKVKALIKCTEVFIDIHEKLWKSGLYIPKRDVYDTIEMFEEHYGQETKKNIKRGKETTEEDV